MKYTFSRDIERMLKFKTNEANVMHFHENLMSIYHIAAQAGMKACERLLLLND
jgi:hypothetical protein